MAAFGASKVVIRSYVRVRCVFALVGVYIDWCVYGRRTDNAYNAECKLFLLYGRFSSILSASFIFTYKTRLIKMRGGEGRFRAASAGVRMTRKTIHTHRDWKTCVDTAPADGN